MITETESLSRSGEQTRSPYHQAFPRVLSMVGWLLILANFLWFSAAAVNSHFAPDEMMNMGWAWEAGVWKIFGAIAEFWSGFYRPTGALYYLTFYRLAGLNPVPFRVFDLCLLGFNLLLAYRYAKLFSRSEFVALLSTFVFSYQVSISIWTTYNGAFAYDRICFTFYFLAFLLYLEARQQDRVPGVGRQLAVVVLYVFALGAKEIAVTLPVLMLAYELVWHRPAMTRSGVIRWSRQTLPLIALMAAMTLAYCFGKTHGANAIVLNPAYRPTDITISHFFHSQSQYMNELLLKLQTHKPMPPALLVFAVMFGLAAAFRDRCLGFSALHALIGPLPIVFLERGGGCLYIVYLGWTLFVAQLVYRVGWWLTEKLRIPVEYEWMPTAALAVIGLSSLLRSNLWHQHFAGPAMLHNGDVTWRTITDLNRLRPSIPSHSTVAYLHTPFKDWDMFFISELWRDDPTVHVVLTEKTPLTPAELSKVPTVLGFGPDGDLHQFSPATGQVLPPS